MGQLAPDWWMCGVTRSGTRNAPFRELSRNASKGGGAKNGVERRGGAPRYKRADRKDPQEFLTFGESQKSSYPSVPILQCLSKSS